MTLLTIIINININRDTKTRPCSRSLIDAEVAAAFMLDMSHHCHPEVVAEDVATSLLGQVGNIMTVFYIYFTGYP